MPGPNISKAGSIPIHKVGHTTGKNQGTNVMSQMKGESRESQATPVVYNK